MNGCGDLYYYSCYNKRSPIVSTQSAVVGRQITTCELPIDFDSLQEKTVVEDMRSFDFNAFEMRGQTEYT